MQELDASGEAGLGAILGADLHDAVVFRGGGDHLAAFPDGVAHRLFNVDVFAGLTGPDGEEGVPVVGRDDEDGVDVGAGEERARIGRGERGGAGAGEERGDLGHLGGIDVTEGDDAGIGALEDLLDVGGAFGPAADEAEADRAVGTDGRGPDGRTQAGGGEAGGGGDGGVAEKGAAAEWRHGRAVGAKVGK